MERVEMYKVREIFRLLFECNLSCREIGKSLNIGKSTVNDFANRFKKTQLRYQDIQSMSDTDILELLNMAQVNTNQRFKDLSVQFQYFEKELKKAHVTIATLWEEYRKEHPEGYSLSHFTFHLQRWRGHSKATMHIDHIAGDKMFVDFTGKHLFIMDSDSSKTIPVEVFVAILPASSFTYVEAVLSQKKQDFFSAVENALWYFGGVPKAIVPDCLKSAVTRAEKYEPEINRNFLDFAKHYQTAVVPARPLHPKDKAMVEGAVQIVYQRIFARLRNQVFRSLKDLNQSIMVLLDEYNRRPMQITKISRLEMFNEVEKEMLKPLPSDLYESKKYARSTVGFNYHIYLAEDKHFYSVPHRFIKKKVDVVYSKTDVEIYYDHIRIAFHCRSSKANGYTTLTDHMPDHHRFYQSWSPEKFLSQADDIGAEVRKLIEVVLNVKEHPEQGYRTCLGILSLSKKHPADRMNQACRKALHYNAHTMKYVKNILENNLLSIDDKPLLTDQKQIEHANIRGNQYIN